MQFNGVHSFASYNTSHITTVAEKMPFLSYNTFIVAAMILNETVKNDVWYCNDSNFTYPYQLQCNEFEESQKQKASFE